MAKSESKVSVQQAEKANEAVHQLIVTSEDQGISLEEAFDLISQVDKAKLFDLSTSYLKMEVGTEYVMLVRGVENVNIKGKETAVVKMENRAGESFVAGDKLLLDAVRRLTQIPCFIVINCKEVKESTQGKYRVLEIKTFASNVQQGE